MIIIDHNSKTPLYEQIKVQILSLITSGALSPGDKLPSLRTLAADLSLNFNTIKKVFAQLEADGVIITVQGKGCFVADTARENRAVLDRAENTLKEALAVARASGLSKETATRILTEVYTDVEV
ncbi:MAG: GntR family transcriptional regulator [Clostridia bacterium]|nr:GntR family transcriptional regulator [Clostridia bacterium]